MKLKSIILAVALATASATSAGADAVTAPTQTRLPTTQLSDPLDSCQLAYYAHCMAKFGDHGGCVEQAQSYACP